MAGTNILLITRTAPRITRLLQNNNSLLARNLCNARREDCKKLLGQDIGYMLQRHCLNCQTTLAVCFTTLRTM